MISVADFFFIYQMFTIWKQRQRNTRWHKVHPRYFYVYLNKGHMPAKDSLWVDNSLCVDNSKSENLYQTNTYVINPIGLFFWLKQCFRSKTEEKSTVLSTLY